MYKILLILRYFQRRLVALFALLAVTLCTAMVIIVISVMGGFLDFMTKTAKNLSGDVVVQRDLTGFPHYEQLISGIRELPEVSGAAAIVRGFGLIKMHDAVRGVYLSGIRADEYNTVTNYRKALHWTSELYLDYFDQLEKHYGESMAESLSRQRHWFEQHDLVAQSMKFRGPLGERVRPGIVPGIAVSPVNTRNKKGEYELWHLSTGSQVAVTVLPITMQGDVSSANIRPAVEEFMVVNEFKSGFMELDRDFVYLPFDVLQRMLDMGEKRDADPETGEYTGDVIPARTTEIVVRGSDGYSLTQIEQAVDTCVQRFAERHDTGTLLVKNWLEDRWGTILAAVQKEKIMMAFLFGVISLVAVVMVAVIFYMIVMEKTRDIGVLRGLGASRTGIACIFLGYSLLVGIVGASVGLALAALVVVNLNEIQDWLANDLDVSAFYMAAGLMGIILGGVIGGLTGLATGRLRKWILIGITAMVTITLCTAFMVLKQNVDLAEWLNEHIRFQMWDPRIYYFDRIPGRLDTVEVTVIMVSAVVASVMGAMIPAWLAARTDPVGSLRYE